MGNDWNRQGDNRRQPDHGANGENRGGCLVIAVVGLASWWGLFELAQMVLA